MSGDGWTPLMAAVVADRRDVGTLLLWAAGAELGLGSTQERQPVKTLTESIMVTEETKKLQVKVNGSTNLRIMTQPQLLDVQNRYGQTALHIAAQKGSVWFVESLLSAGALVDVQNSYGLRALDVAKLKKQKAAADILRQWEAGQGGKSERTDEATVGKKSTRKLRKNKGKTSNSSENKSLLNPTLDCVVSPPCCSSSAGGRTVLINENISEPLEAIALLPISIDDPCQDPSVGVVDGLVVEDVGASGHVVNGVHGFVQAAVSDSHCAVIQRQNESNCMVPCSCHPVPNPL